MNDPPVWPVPDDDVRQALEAAYADGSWGQYSGVHTDRLTERLATFYEIPHVLLCGSGTYAVELALRALGVGPGDEVAMAAYDFPGNFLTVHALGARPLLVDLDPRSWQLSLDALAESAGPQTRVVLASHLHGGLVPMARLMAMAADHGWRVVEDAAQCPGALVEGRRAGAWGDVGVLSFGGSKLLTAGRGGAILTRHADVLQRARVASHRGNVVAPLSQLQAAVLLPQLDKLDSRNEVRREAVGQLRGVPGLQPIDAGQTPDRAAYYKVGFQYDEGSFGLTRTRFLAAVRAEGVALDEGFRALHAGRSPSRYRSAGALPEADRAHRAMVILHHPVLLVPNAVHELVAAFERVRTAGLEVHRT